MSGANYERRLASDLPLIQGLFGRCKVVYAVIESGGKQFKVSEGQSLEVERLPYALGERVELDRVLMIADEAGVKVGQPVIEGAKVLATVTHQGRRRKILVFKYKPKERYRRRAGHRQAFTRLRVDKIVV